VYTLGWIVGSFLCATMLYMNYGISKQTPEVTCRCGNVMTYDQFYEHRFFHKFFETVMCTVCGKMQKIPLSRDQKFIILVNLFILITFLWKILFV
jgi:hypothetical protein